MYLLCVDDISLIIFPSGSSLSSPNEQTVDSSEPDRQMTTDVARGLKNVVCKHFALYLTQVIVISQGLVWNR